MFQYFEGQIPSDSIEGSIAIRHPIGFQLISTHETRAQCTSACFLNGNLVMGCTDGVKHLGQQSHEVKDWVNSFMANVAVNDGEIFVSQRTGINTVELISFKMHDNVVDKLFSFHMECTEAAYLSVTSKFIACIDKDAVALKLFDRSSKVLQTLSLPNLTRNIINLHFLHDGCLLATGSGNGKLPSVNKYSLGSSKGGSYEMKADLLWSCPLPLACGIAVTDDEQIIFISEQSGKKVYVVNHDGRLMSGCLNMPRKRMIGI